MTTEQAPAPQMYQVTGTVQEIQRKDSDPGVARPWTKWTFKLLEPTGESHYYGWFSELGAKIKTNEVVTFNFTTKPNPSNEQFPYRNVASLVLDNDASAFPTPGPAPSAPPTQGPTPQSYPATPRSENDGAHRGMLFKEASRWALKYLDLTAAADADIVAEVAHIKVWFERLVVVDEECRAIFDSRGSEGPGETSLPSADEPPDYEPPEPDEDEFEMPEDNEVPRPSGTYSLDLVTDEKTFKEYMADHNLKYGKDMTAVNVWIGAVDGRDHRGAANAITKKSKSKPKPKDEVVL